MNILIAGAVQKVIMYYDTCIGRASLFLQNLNNIDLLPKVFTIT